MTSLAARSPSALRSLSIFFDLSAASFSPVVLTAQPILAGDPLSVRALVERAPCTKASLYQVPSKQSWLASTRPRGRLMTLVARTCGNRPHAVALAYTHRSDARPRTLGLRIRSPLVVPIINARDMCIRPPDHFQRKATRNRSLFDSRPSITMTMARNCCCYSTDPHVPARTFFTTRTPFVTLPNFAPGRAGHGQDSSRSFDRDPEANPRNDPAGSTGLFAQSKHHHQ